MDQLNHWEMLASQAEQEVTKEMLDRSPVRGAEMMERHSEGGECHCSYCEPTDNCTLDRGRQRGPDPVFHQDDCKVYRPEQEVEVYECKKLTHSEERARIKAIESENAKLPPLSHREINDPQIADKVATEYLKTYTNDEREKEIFGNLPKLKGVLVFYINVGQLPPAKADAFIERMQSHIEKKLPNRLPDTWTTLWLPTRDTDTHVETMRFD